MRKNKLLVMLAILFISAGAVVWAQGNGLALGKKKAKNHQVVVDLGTFATENLQAKMAYDPEKSGPPSHETTYNVATYEDGDVTCYILNGDSATPMGFSCVQRR